MASLGGAGRGPAGLFAAGCVEDGADAGWEAVSGGAFFAWLSLEQAATVPVPIASRADLSTVRRSTAMTANVRSAA
ncbi:hypothetical protein [Kribbella hippodromi]|uniref:hypothetical protein n=1 Tax=Kribbella hippodromi TaxID=434347 RepID=UPI0031DAFE73